VTRRTAVVVVVVVVVVIVIDFTGVSRVKLLLHQH